VESRDSEEACLKVEDVTPPLPPTGIAVVVREGAIEVSWSPSPEPDLARYRIYRAVVGEEGPPQRVAEISPPETSFRDTDLETKRVYSYRVTAVDKAGNESEPSVEAEGHLP